VPLLAPPSAGIIWSLRKSLRPRSKALIICLTKESKSESESQIVSQELSIVPSTSGHAAARITVSMGLGLVLESLGFGRGCCMGIRPRRGEGSQVAVDCLEC
jgi:hypothetical protein